MDYYCEVCDKTIKLKYKKKHLNAKSHTALSMSVVNRHCVKNSELIEIEKKHVNNYNKKFCLYEIICEWKMEFIDTTVRVKSKRMCNIERHHSILTRYLTMKIKYFNRLGLKFSHTSEMIVTFISSLLNMTYEHYLNQPKPMIE